MRSVGATALAAGATLALLAASAAPSPARPRPPLTVVALGDSSAYGRYTCGNCRTFVRRFAQALGQRTKRRVRVQNLARPARIDSAALRAQVDTYPEIRTAVARANAVIVTVGRDDKPWVSTTDSCDGAATFPNVDWERYDDECLAANSERYELNIRAILAAIRNLRGGKRTLIRLTIPYNELLGTRGLSADGAAVSAEVAEDYASATCEAGLRRRASCVDVLHAFNGLGGRRSAKRLLARDHTNPNARGHRVIARLLVQDGFAPLARRR